MKIPMRLPQRFFLKFALEVNMRSPQVFSDTSQSDLQGRERLAAAANHLGIAADQLAGLKGFGEMACPIPQIEENL